MISSLYRVQLSPDLTLKKLIQLIPYFHQLGIEGIYCSPIYESFSCNYDITDPNRLNPVLGSAKDFKNFCSTMKKYRMKIVLDVVPNHISIRSRWWNDVLEQGQNSPFAEFFDIDWQKFRGKILLPILDCPFEEALKKGEIKLVHGKIRYSNYTFPIRQNGKVKSLRKLLEWQHYRLAHWKVAAHEINYRRFFNINELVALRMEKENVLEAHHKWIFSLIKSGVVQGIRIDHPDGLYDPTQYFERVQKRKPILVWVEKILGLEEHLPQNWKVDGTVGYEFLNLVSGVFVEKKNERSMTDIYQKFIGKKVNFDEIHYERRKFYMANQIAGEIQSLSALLGHPNLIDALIEIIACFPVYRTYVRFNRSVRKEDRSYIHQAVNAAKKRNPAIDPTLFDTIEEFLLLKQQNAVDFTMRFQQLTPSIMAKALEDSTFYLYNRLISLNEVGGCPTHFGYTKEEFHAFNQYQLSNWPLGLLASSTHDSKYSEDARLRIHAVSEMPKEWGALVRSLTKRNKKYKTNIREQLAPDANTEYYIYQMLVALWGASPNRFWICLRKAIREAGLYTSWVNIDEQYESAVKKFLLGALKPSASFLKFQKKTAKHAYWNSLSALVLKIGSCGIPDIYQGSEIMNYTLVDPDNRRPINFEIRKTKLQQLSEKKIFITSRGLNFRKKNKELFLRGKYIPLTSPENVIAFMRELDGKKVIIMVKRFNNSKLGKMTIPHKITYLYDIFSKNKIPVINGKINLKEVFKTEPFAILSNRAIL